MIESLCCAVVSMGVVASLSLVAAVQYRIRLGVMRRNRDRLLTENAVLRRALAENRDRARGVNRSIDRIVEALAGELIAKHQSAHEGTPPGTRGAAGG